ncbi:hypothetical protein V565_068220 [Rhizoctonia solani 123E]|uniref:Uncharacterized protein n=2 Tax=Rhizoctonia solani TaxID=456999 RepID=A0A074S2E9_9AGAM|nr:hypothetical protein V565_068220 [Rhizoctonia solani 123E]
MRRDSTYVPSSTAGSVRSELDNYSEAESVDTVIHDGSFECRGHGLLVDRFPCETPAKLKQLLRPDESSGVMPISNHERRRKWWRAQCIHYGLRVPANASIDTYRAYLRSIIPHQVELKRPQEHIELEERLNQAYHDAKAHGKGDIAAAPVSAYKRHESEICDQVTRANKRVCVSERLPDPRTHTPTDLDVSRLNYLDVLRQHELNMFIGMYSLELNEVSPTSRSKHAPTLVIAAGFDKLRFEGFIKLPGIMSCALVFELGTFSKQAERRRITVRFKWRGKQNFIPGPSQVGQLTLDIEHRRLKGLIGGPVQARFKGTRINSAQRELSHRWEDLDVTSA